MLFFKDPNSYHRGCDIFTPLHAVVKGLVVLAGEWEGLLIAVALRIVSKFAIYRDMTYRSFDISEYRSLDTSNIGLSIYRNIEHVLAIHPLTFPYFFMMALNESFDVSTIAIVRVDWLFWLYHCRIEVEARSISNASYW